MSQRNSVDKRIEDGKSMVMAQRNSISSAMSDISFHISTALNLFASDPHLHYLRVLALLVISPHPLQLFLSNLSSALLIEGLDRFCQEVSMLSMHMIHKKGCDYILLLPIDGNLQVTTPLSSPERGVLS